MKKIALAFFAVLLLGCVTETDTAIDSCKQKANETGYEALQKRVLCDVDVLKVTWATKISKLNDPTSSFGKVHKPSGIAYTIAPQTLEEQTRSYSKQMTEFADDIGKMSSCHPCSSSEVVHGCNSCPFMASTDEVRKVVERWENLISSSEGYTSCDLNPSKIAVLFGPPGTVCNRCNGQMFDPICGGL